MQKQIQFSSELMYTEILVRMGTREGSLTPAQPDTPTQTRTRATHEHHPTYAVEN